MESLSNSNSEIDARMELPRFIITKSLEETSVVNLSPFLNKK